MLNRSALCAACFFSLTAGSLLIPQGQAFGFAEEPILGEAFVVADPQTPRPAVDPSLQEEIAIWLSQNFNLPVGQPLPRIELVPPARIAAIRYRGLQPQGPSSEHAGQAARRAQNIVAVFDDKQQTIYLPEGWRGDSPAEQSVLVHEMVHYLQGRAGMKYECPQAREKLAYQAQDEWLNRFGLTLESEFEIDPFSRLVHTNCMM